MKMVLWHQEFINWQLVLDMIINHKYKFIFIKTRKTAGTSIEVALSGLCDSGDVITPIIPEDEKVRKEMGVSGPRNYVIPFEFYNESDHYRFLKLKRPKQYYNHAPAMFIKENVKGKIWDSYFKFCFERNPFDKAVSRYYWGIRDLKSKPEISSYLKNLPRHLLSDWNMYTVEGKIIVDFIGAYENLHRDFALVLNKLNITENVRLPNLKGNYRKDRRHYSNILSLQDRVLIEQICKNELKYFSYSWQNDF